jgi:hypothetical protein
MSAKYPRTATSIVWRVLSDFPRPELGHSFGIVVQRVDLGSLVFKGNYHDYSKCSVDNIHDDVVIDNFLEDKLTNLKDKNQSSVLNLLVKNIFYIRIAGHRIVSVCCKKREFVISLSEESVDGFRKLEGLLGDLIGARRVNRMTKIGRLMKECICDY